MRVIVRPESPVQSEQGVPTLALPAHARAALAEGTDHPVLLGAFEGLIGQPVDAFEASFLRMRTFSLPELGEIEALLAPALEVGWPAGLAHHLGPVANFAARAAAWCASLGRLLDLDVQAVRVKLALEQGQPCPKFHVDTLPFRAIATLAGPGTQWLADQDFDRERWQQEAEAHPCSCPLASLLDPGAIRSLPTGMLALLPGKTCPGRKGRGTLHRSPPARPGQVRLVLTLDPLASGP